MKATATLLLALVNPATAAVYNMKWYASADCTGDVMTGGTQDENNIYTDSCYVTDDDGVAPHSAKLVLASGVIGTVTYPSLDCTGTAGACPTTIGRKDSDCVTGVTAGTCKVVDQNGAKSVMVTATTKPTTISTESPAYWVAFYTNAQGADCSGPYVTSLFPGHTTQTAAGLCKADDGMYSQFLLDTADPKQTWMTHYRTSSTCAASAMTSYSGGPVDTCILSGLYSMKIQLGTIVPYASSAASASVGIVAAGLAVAAAAVLA